MSLVRVVIICPASTHTALVSSPSLAVLHLSTYLPSNNFNLLLHETFGSGFSPTAVLKLRRLARKVARGRYTANNTWRVMYLAKF